MHTVWKNDIKLISISTASYFFLSSEHLKCAPLATLVYKEHYYCIWLLCREIDLDSTFFMFNRSFVPLINVHLFFTPSSSLLSGSSNLPPTLPISLAS